MRVCDHVQNVKRRDTVSPDATVGSEPAEAAGCRPLDEVRRALRVGGRGEDRAVVSLEDMQPVGNVGGVVLTRLKRQIKVGTEERSTEFRHEFFDCVAFGPERVVPKSRAKRDSLDTLQPARRRSIARWWPASSASEHRRSASEWLWALRHPRCGYPSSVVRWSRSSSALRSPAGGMGPCGGHRHSCSRSGRTTPASTSGPSLCSHWPGSQPPLFPARRAAQTDPLITLRTE